MAGDDASASQDNLEISPDMLHKVTTLLFHNMFPEGQVRRFLHQQAKESGETRASSSFSKEEVEACYRKVGRWALGHPDHETEEDHPLASVYSRIEPMKPEDVSTMEWKVGGVWAELDETVFRRQVKKELSIGSIKPPFPNAEDVRRETYARSTAIMQHHSRLRDIVDRHEETIIKRWAKKSPPKRLKVLLQAWPDMIRQYQYYWETEISTKQLDDGRKEVYTQADKEATMWPHINQTDLVKSRLLPLFIKSRARTHSSVFWNVYNKSAFTTNDAAEACGMVHLCRHVMRVNATSSGSEAYAELIPFDTKGQANRLMMDGGQPVGYGLLCLALQEKTLDFLVRCCESILHDISPDELLKYPVLPEPTIQDSDPGVLPSLSAMVLEARYEAPKNVDVSRIKTLLLAKRSAAEDHVWALREDPSYFFETLYDVMDHRYEHIKDRAGKLHPDLKDKNKVWKHVINNVVAAADWHLEAWSNLYYTLSCVEKSFRRYGGIPKERAPKPLRIELDCLFFYLDRTLSGLRAQLRATLELSPNMRPYNCRAKGDTTESKKTSLYTPKLRQSWFDENAKEGLGKSPEEKMLMCVYYLTEDVMPNCPPSMYYMRFSSTLHQLSQLVEHEPRVRRLVSSAAARIISDMSVISEALRQLLFHDLKAGTEVGSPHLEAAREAKIAIPWMNEIDIIDVSNPEEFYALCVPPDQGRFHYPSEKRRTQKNHEAMRAAETNLDAFWKKFDANADKGQQRHLSKLEPGTVEHVETEIYRRYTKDLLRQRGCVQRLEPWVEPTVEKQKQRQKENVPSRPLSEMYFDLERSTERTVAKDSVQKTHLASAKKKTRGVSSPLKEGGEHSTGPLPPSQQPDIQPTFALNARAHKVFRTLFFYPDPSSTPGEVAWPDFLYAMAATGFQVEKLYGSVWQFKPTRLGVEHGIHFHEPHPSGKIHSKMCRNFGSRLSRNYGWSGDMFVLADKKSAAQQKET